ncbi:hypothetical protein Cantr_06455 [Candida viswanathii]|uniref:Uncharacterized protein n=1 Tax=Candida viswanathii TaxID=5486 RepID=A0A367XWP3_9ASCO|nr:hypothetical protein Cantr_06455 [Candida viswanathii]
MRRVGEASCDWFKMFSNNDELRLDCLTELELYDMGGFENLGPLPRSLRTIKFHNTAGINPDDFKYLTHLTSLSITSMDGRSFVCQLPPSLLQLEMRETFFTTVQLEAENLRYLKL